MIFIVVVVYTGYGESSPWSAHTTREKAESALSALNKDPENYWKSFFIVECELL